MNNSSRSNIKKVNNVKNNDRRNINQKNYIRISASFI